MPAPAWTRLDVTQLNGAFWIMSMTAEKVLEVIEDVENKLKFAEQLPIHSSEPRPPIEEALLRRRLETNTGFRKWLKATCTLEHRELNVKQRTYQGNALQHQSYRRNERKAYAFEAA